LQLGTYFGDQLLALRIWHFGKRVTGGGRTGSKVLYKILGRRKAHELGCGLNLYIAEARFSRGTDKFFGISQRKWAPRGLRIDPVAFEYLGESIVAFTVFYRSPNAGSQTSCGC
jgi:hypothetical protein